MLDKDTLLDLALTIVQADELDGVCTSCGFIQSGIDPDQEGVTCEECGSPNVMGAENVLINYGV